MRCDKLGFGETKGKKVYMLNWIRSSREGLTKLNDKFWNFFPFFLSLLHMNMMLWFLSRLIDFE